MSSSDLVSVGSLFKAFFLAFAEIIKLKIMLEVVELVTTFCLFSLFPNS